MVDGDQNLTVDGQKGKSLLLVLTLSYALSCVQINVAGGQQE